MVVLGDDVGGGDLAMFPTLADEEDDADLFLLVHIGQFYKH